MGTALDISNELDSIVIPAELNPDRIIDAFNRKFIEFGIEGIYVDDIDITSDGDIFVTFAGDDNFCIILFKYDSQDGAQAYIIGDEYEDSNQIIIQLDFLNPSIIKTIYGDFIHLSDLSWLTKPVLMSILSNAGFKFDIEKHRDVKYDEIGHVLNPSIFSEIGSEVGEDFNEDSSINEIYKWVIRGGKKVKVALVRRMKKKRLTSHQRLAIRRGALKRKRLMSRILRKRKRSLSIRKRQSIRSPKLPKSRFGYKLSY